MDRFQAMQLFNRYVSTRSLTVFAGELIAMVGPSGAGKTTLISALSGVARHDRGEVRLGGRDFHQMLAADPSLVGFVPQDDLIHPELSVESAALLELPFLRGAFSLVFMDDDALYGARHVLLKHRILRANPATLANVWGLREPVDRSHHIGTQSQATPPGTTVGAWRFRL